MNFTESAWEVSQESLPGGPGYDPGPEEIPAAYQNRMDAWVNADTGRIITEAEARKLLGPRGQYHADKCRCDECDNDNGYWRDE